MTTEVCTDRVRLCTCAAPIPGAVGAAVPELALRTYTAVHSVCECVRVLSICCV
jgi:hypothetical protein